ncbi:MAG: hypothetical protein KGZ25_02725 [Planctomycetes bacterium]|nr:hypothetical protein [Planctomycetota bacterium]
MPIEYKVFGGGHLIHAIAHAPVTAEEFVEYEMQHAIDDRINRPVSELLEVQPGALSGITKRDVSTILERRQTIERDPKRHRCGIVVSYGDNHGWDIAKFYEGMVVLHSPEVVIIFGDLNIARRWLGFEQYESENSADIGDS